MGRFWSLRGNSIHLVLHVHPKCKRLALTYSRVRGQPFMNTVEMVFLDGCFREHVVLGWNVRDHLCTFLSSESDNELYEYMTEAFEFSFPTEPTSISPRSFQREKKSKHLPSNPKQIVSFYSAGPILNIFPCTWHFYGRLWPLLELVSAGDMLRKRHFLMVP